MDYEFSPLWLHFGVRQIIPNLVSLVSFESPTYQRPNILVTGHTCQPKDLPFTVHQLPGKAMLVMSANSRYFFWLRIAHYN